MIPKWSSCLPRDAVLNPYEVGLRSTDLPELVEIRTAVKYFCRSLYVRARFEASPGGSGLFLRESLRLNEIIEKRFTRLAREVGLFN